MSIDYDKAGVRSGVEHPGARKSMPIREVV
jgi:hypothetical protein